ncbi:MAG: alpha-mannosidase [Anaerolineae bacterium]
MSPFDTRRIGLYLAGHAHMDLAWLWPWRETVYHVAPNTFRDVIRQMDAGSDLIFVQGQAALWEVLERYYPALFEAAAEKVRQGKLAPLGGMWSEPDDNIPSGESQVRQFLYGKRYFYERFGVDVRTCFAPDTFGHAATMPQIMAACGIDNFLFCKMSIGHTAFWWEGPDGSRVLAYKPPEYWYNLRLNEVQKNVQDNLEESYPLDTILLVYGEGDHGGGPREEDLEALEGLRAEGAWRFVEHAPPDTFLAEVRGQRDVLPTHCGDIIQDWRACWTELTHTKWANRRGENLLLSAEKLAWIASGLGLPYRQEELAEAWKGLLLNQFHDIITGACYPPAHEEAASRYADILRSAERVRDEAADMVCTRVRTRAQAGYPLVVFNTTDAPRSDVVQAQVYTDEPAAQLIAVDEEGRAVPCQILSSEETGSDYQKGFLHSGHRWVVPGQLYRHTLLFLARDVPPMGYRTFWVQPTAGQPVEPSDALQAEGTVLENAFLRLELDPADGTIRRLWDKRRGVDVLDAQGGGNRLALFEEGLDHHDAWVVSFTGGCAATIVEGVELVEQGPVRATLQVRSRFGLSTFTQRVSLLAGLPRVECALNADWQEKHQFLKVEFPLAAHAPCASFAIPYGVQDRPSDGRDPVQGDPAGRTSREVGLGSELPAQAWVSVSDGTGGAAVLNDSKYAYDVLDNVVHLSVVRGSVQPDPYADVGAQHCRYALLPHAGTWRDTDLPRQGEAYNQPLLAVPWPYVNIEESLPASHAFVQVSPANVMLSVVKQAEDGEGCVLRLLETHGNACRAQISMDCEIRTALETDAVELADGEYLTPEGNSLSVELKAHELKTLKLVLASR